MLVLSFICWSALWRGDSSRQWASPNVFTPSGHHSGENTRGQDGLEASKASFWIPLRYPKPITGDSGFEKSSTRDHKQQKWVALDDLRHPVSSRLHASVMGSIESDSKDLNGPHDEDFLSHEFDLLLKWHVSFAHPSTLEHQFLCLSVCVSFRPFDIFLIFSTSSSNNTVSLLTSKNWYYLFNL